MSVVPCRIGLVAFAGLVLAACHSTPTCETTKGDYRSAKDQSPLRVPEGMASPDRSAALVVPPAAAGAPPLVKPVKGDACLESPPSYFGSSGSTARTPEQLVASWAKDWSDRNVDGVITLYSESFVAPADAGRGPWLNERREQIATGPVPDAKLSDLQIRNDGDDRRIVSFRQRFGGNEVRKELTLVRESGSWRIAAERVLDVH